MGPKPLPNSSLDCLLVSPPHWYPFEPYQALPALQSYLRAQGFTTEILDLNLSALDYFLTRDTMTKVLAKAEERSYGSSAADFATDLENRKKAFRKVALVSDNIIGQVETAKDVLRGPLYYDYYLHCESLRVIYLAMKIIGACYYPTRYTFNSFIIRANYCNPAELLRFSASEAENPFLHYIRKELDQAIVHRRPRVLGINVTGTTQVVGGITAAYVAKKLHPDIHVVLGGSYFSRLAGQMARFPQLFEVVDSVILYEGEIALAELLSAIRNSQDLNTVPQHLWFDPITKRVEKNGKLATPDIESLPPPDPEGMALEFYLTPETILPVSASRGCYWDRCEFCDHGFCYRGGYREKPAHRVIEEMKLLNSRYGVRHFDIVDEAVNPPLIESFCRMLLDGQYDFRWLCLARIDRRFNYKTFRLMHDAGCRLLSFGVESHDSGILKRMNKGTTPELNLRVLSDSVRAGIWTHIMVFFGFPGEDDAAAQRTFSLIRKHDDVFNDAGAAAFVLGRHSRILNRPEHFEIDVAPQWTTSTDLAYDIVLPYTVNGQDTFTTAERRAQEFQSLTVNKKGSFERLTAFFYCDKYETNDFSRFKKIFETHGIRRQMGDLLKLEGVTVEPATTTREKVNPLCRPNATIT